MVNNLGKRFDTFMECLLWSIIAIQNRKVRDFIEDNLKHHIDKGSVIYQGGVNDDTND